MNTKKLKIARNKIDAIDAGIFQLIKNRHRIVKQVISIKEFKNQIIDQKRIKRILNNIKKKSIKNKIDPKITIKIWKAIIWSFIDFEKRNFKKK